MSVQAVLLPVFVMVAMTFVLMFWMGAARASSIRHGQVKVKDIALGQSAWPVRETQLGNAFHNQLQLPMLFYVLVVLAMLTRQADLLFVAMSWVFVVLRIAHAGIHVTSNYVPRRFYAFLAGAIVLLSMWLIFAVRLLVAA